MKSGASIQDSLDASVVTLAIGSLGVRQNVYLYKVMTTSQSVRLSEARTPTNRRRAVFLRSNR